MVFFRDDFIAVFDPGGGDELLFLLLQARRGPVVSRRTPSRLGTPFSFNGSGVTLSFRP